MSKPIGLATDEHKPEPLGWRRAWHGWANTVVLVWLAVTVLTATGVAGAPQWLAVHAFLLGTVTTAIVVWGEHFSVALLHATAPDRRWAAARLAAVTAGQVGVLAGMLAEQVAVLAVGAMVFTGAVAAHGWVLLRLRLKALGGRLSGLVDYYLAACAALLAGAPLGALLGAGAGGEAWHGRLHAAHAHLNVGGWVLLTVLGTMFMLWPTTVGTRMVDSAAPAFRWCLRLTAPGLVLATVGLLSGHRGVAGAGVAVYAAGVLVAMVPFVATLRVKRPSSGAAWLLAASVGWLLVGVLLDLRLVLGAGPDRVAERLGVLGPVLLVGVVAQVLLGSLAFLLPVVLGGGLDAVRAARRHFDRGWPLRLAGMNAGLAALAVPGPALLARAGVVLLVVTVAEFVLRALWLVVPRLSIPAPAAGRRPVLAGLAAGTGLTVLAVTTAYSGTPGGAHGTHQAGAAAAGTRTVAVELSGMRARPAVIDVPAGTRVILTVTNTDTRKHDLRTAGGTRTPMLAKGQTATLDVGVVRETVNVWCTVPGHKAAGMALTIRTGAAGTDSAAGHGGHAGTTGGAWDPQAKFGAGFIARDATLPPAPAAVLHRVELPVVEKDIEVAPGVRQRMWTFAGTVPGPTLRGKVGDEFEVTLVNTGTLGHGVDFHAGANAPDGVMRTIEPGERLVYRFRADRAGAWLYHCSTMPMTQHLAAGMFGAVVIDPTDLAPADREYVMVAGELYLGDPGGDAVTGALRAGTPHGWVFNGAANQYDAAPLTARVAERVRIWVVAAGPGSTTAFHVVGTRFDAVYKEGAYLLRSGTGGAQVLDLAPAQGGFVEMTFPEPGHYPFVDHDLRHAEAGAHGVIAVTS